MNNKRLCSGCDGQNNLNFRATRCEIPPVCNTDEITLQPLTVYYLNEKSTDSNYFFIDITEIQDSALCSSIIIISYTKRE